MRLLFGMAFGLDGAKKSNVKLIPVPESAVQISLFAATALFQLMLVHVIKAVITLGHNATVPNR